MAGEVGKCDTILAPNCLASKWTDVLQLRQICDWKKQCWSQAKEGSCWYWLARSVEYLFKSFDFSTYRANATWMWGVGILKWWIIIRQSYAVVPFGKTEIRPISWTGNSPWMMQNNFSSTVNRLQWWRNGPDLVRLELTLYPMVRPNNRCFIVVRLRQIGAVIASTI